MLPYIVAPLLLVLSSVASVSAAFTVDSPAINQCKDTTFHLAGYTGDVYLNVLPSVDPCQHDPIFEVGPISIGGDGSYTWHNTQVAAGTSVVVVFDDGANHEVWTNTIVVGGSASDCPQTTAPSAAHSTTRATTASHAATSAPVNAAQGTQDDSSGAFNVKASWATGLLTLLVGAAFLA
jgi:hypothetical protein